MQITGAVLRGPGAPLLLEELQLADPRPDEVIIRLVSSGICHTDIAAMQGGPRTKYPMVLGHEGAGVVEAIGSGVTRLAVGDHAVLSFDYCAVCDRCQSGLPSYCRQFVPRNFSGGRVDGTSALAKDGEHIYGHYFGQSSFATHAVAREANAIKVRKDVPLEMLGPLGCGIQTGAGAVINTFGARPGSSVAVFGTGSVGLGAVMGAAVAGCTTIIGVDVLPQRLDTAVRMGATHVLNGRDSNVAEKIIEITGRGVNFAFDTTGIPSVLEQAMLSLDELGTCGLVGGQQNARLDIPFPSLARGRSIRTIIEGDAVPSQFIPMMVDLYLQGRFPLDRMITYFPFDDINRAATSSEAGEVIKPVLTFS